MEKFLIQKTQRIVSALYLITDIIKDNDAIKWEIREEGISLVSHSLMINAAMLSEKEHAIRLVVTSLEKIVALLNISMTSYVISKMNATIVTHEIESLLDFVRKEMSQNHLSGYILSDSFFAEEMGLKDGKGQGVVDSTQKANLDKVKSDKGQGRTEAIIGLLKKDSNLTIKDFTKVIKDCSEKTIQRELISLVKKGIVKRLGERRWSTYSLS